jgi:hypothetical protein
MTVEVASVLVDVVVFFLCPGIFPPCGNGNEETKGRSMPVLLPRILLFGKTSLYTKLGMASPKKRLSFGYKIKDEVENLLLPIVLPHYPPQMASALMDLFWAP